jgi:hypothetical protein
MAKESATVEELTAQQNEKLAKQFAGILQSVVPNVTKSLATASKAFSKSLITGSNKRIETTYGNLKTFLNNFDVSISNLGSGFKDVEEAFKGLKNQFDDADDKIEKLREKNIFAEKELFVNKKNNNLEVRATILTDQKLFEKRQEILEKEKKLEDKDKNYLEQIRQVQTGKNVISDKQNANLTQDFQKNRDKLKNIQAEKELYQGKSGKGGDSSIGVVDKFERFLEDRGPSFLTSALGPIINIARDFEKTIKLMISGISGIISGIKKAANFVGKLLPDSFKKGLGNIMKGLGGRLKSFGKSLGLASLGLIKFVGRILLTGLTMLLAIVAPLLPLIPPLLLFAVAIAAVVGAIYLLKKAFTALVDWFRNSWLGKKLGLDKESMDKAEVKDKKEGTGKYQGFADEMEYGDTGSPGDKGSPKVIAEKPLMPANTGNGEKFRGTKDSKGRSQIERFEDEQKQIALQKSQNPEALKRQEGTDVGPSPREFQKKAGVEFYANRMPPEEQSKTMRELYPQDKFKKPDTIKKDLKGEGTSTSSNVTTVVNNQPSSSNTQVANTSMFSPINVSSGDSYFDRQANASNF